jgi:hypothetical protein
MGAGGSTGCPDPSEDFAFGDLLAGLYPISLEVKVHREQATAMMQDH